MSTEPNHTRAEELSSKRWMCVEDVAYLLHKTRWAVYKVLERGLLTAEKRGRHWCIPAIEVLRIVYSHPGNRCHVWASELSEKKFKIAEKSIGQNRDLNRCNTDEADAARIAAQAVPGEQFEPRDAAVRLQDEFSVLARSLAPRDLFLQDDLVQEMSLAVLEQTQKANESFFLWLACWRAKDFLKRERMRGGLCPSKLGQLAIDAQKISDETLVQALLDDGETVEMIEEALGLKLVFEEKKERSA